MTSKHNIKYIDYKRKGELNLLKKKRQRRRKSIHSKHGTYTGQVSSDSSIPCHKYIVFVMKILITIEKSINRKKRKNDHYFPYVANIIIFCILHQVRAHLIFRSRWCWKWDCLLIEPLNIVQFHDLVIVLRPPPLSLPFIKQFTADQINKKFIISNPTIY